MVVIKIRSVTREHLRFSVTLRRGDKPKGYVFFPSRHVRVIRRKHCAYLFACWVQDSITLESPEITSVNFVADRDTLRVPKSVLRGFLPFRNILPVPTDSIDEIWYRPEFER